MRGVVLLIVGLIFAGCDGGEKVQPERDLSGEKVEVTVVTYDGPTGELEGRPKGEQGFFRADLDGDWCEVHVRRIDGVDDDVTMTWGHELMHCIYGRYHRKDNQTALKSE